MNTTLWTVIEGLKLIRHSWSKQIIEHERKLKEEAAALGKTEEK
jgi:hypothetical protein